MSQYCKGVPVSRYPFFFLILLLSVFITTDDFPLLIFAFYLFKSS
jgi:hypothetical protein